MPDAPERGPHEAPPRAPGDSRLAAIVARCETLLHDVRLEAVRAWKAQDPARRAVGILPVWFPRELVHAAGMLPVGVVGGGDDVEIIKGDAYFQSYICHLPRSTIEMALNGTLDPLDAMVFPSTCDVIRNLSGMWQMLFPARPAWYFDPPQRTDEIGRDFLIRELAALRQELGALSGTPAGDERLRSAIALFDDNRREVEALYEARRREPWAYPTSEAYLVLRAGNLLPVEEHTALLRAYREAARASGRAPMDNARVLVAGAFCEQPPLNLIRTVERAGCYVVDDDFLLGNRLILGDVAGGGDPLLSIADAFLECSRETAFLYRESGKGNDIVERVRRSGAEGVLFCAPSFCDPALLDQPMLVRALDAAGIPHTAFKYAENTGQFHSIREQAGTFSDSIKLWGAA